MKKKIKNALNPTPQQIKVRNKLWADALVKNKKKATGEMYSDNGGRCCLAVAQDVAIACGLEVDKEYDESYPHPNVGKFFGWDKQLPTLSVPNEKKEEAIELNDESRYSFGTSTGMSHKKIAECVLNTFVRPKTKVWTFKLKEED
jgi:hypothetical protein